MSIHRMIALLLGALLSFAPVAHAKCRGPFKKSCVKALYKCFDAKGACTQQTKLPTFTIDPVTGQPHFVGNSETTTCWANGARQVISVDPNTFMGTFTGTTSKGKPCLSGTFSSDATTLTRRGKSWTLRSAADGSLTVTCPTGKTETYTAAQLDAAPAKCGGRGGAACTEGTCP